MPTPQVRTLLLTDLCDSTMLVERLGDAAAAELFRDHDRLVLGLQQHWGGRLIDRSDGLLLLFERAVDGLGFALDYARGLRAIGERREVARSGVALQARAGLHVGEVLTWRNSDAAVTFGAKPLEVEGLAKPMAGRLMTMARPGQILLSATAESLAHRAARELGERGEQLVWKSWGRWRFKGVPQGQEVYEVGEADIAPLRAPRQDHGKAWRDIPLWRRPAALAAELLLVAGLAAGAWFLAQPQPAIAFAERDWVVVADLRNLTGQPRLDDSLEQAFRVSLEQSRYVNVISDLKARDTLAQMRRPPGAPLDRDTASEVALRDGARAVLLPTVAEVGGRLRVSVEVVDPATQATVYAESADGAGAGSALRSIDRVVAALRGRLGEEMQSIERNAVPLPEATTANLDALKAYALGRRHAAAGDPKQALAYFARAIELDPQFALAMVDAGAVHAHQLGDWPAAHREFERARALRARLGPRDVLRLDAAAARLGPPAPAIRTWRQLLETYPDELAAHLGLGQLALFGTNDAREALRHATAAAIPQAERRGSADYLRGMALLYLGQAAQAIDAFEASRRHGFQGAGFSHAFAYAVRDDWAGVERILARRVPTGIASGEIQLPDQIALLALDRGDWDLARERAAEATRAALASEPLVAGHYQQVRQLVVDVLSGQLPRAAALARIEAAMDAIEAEAARIGVAAPSLPAEGFQALGYLAALLDDRRLLVRATGYAARFDDIAGYPLMGQLQSVLGAELARIDGDPVAAVRTLRPIADRGDAMVIARFALWRALRAAGDDAGAAAQATWLSAHRGQAYIERPAGELLSAASVAATDPAFRQAL
jgi:putative peptide modification system cyclase